MSTSIILLSNPIPFYKVDQKTWEPLIDRIIHLKIYYTHLLFRYSVNAPPRMGLRDTLDHNIKVIRHL